MSLNQSDQWATPDDLFNKLDEEFQFEFDLCASRENHKCSAYSRDIETYVKFLDATPPINSYWMNPPYSRGNIDHCMYWGTAVLRLSELFPTIVTLTRFDPSTEWFQAYIDGVADEVRMLARRVKFVGAPSAYNFPCCVAIYNQPERRVLHADGVTNVTNYNIWDWKE
jgi:phage N-6-adenine-methyltransferase